MVVITGASAGIGFAIPVSLAEPVLESIIETGEVHRGFLGAQVVDVTPTAIEDFGLKVSKGALIRVQMSLRARAIDHANSSLSRPQGPRMKKGRPPPTSTF